MSSHAAEVLRRHALPLAGVALVALVVAWSGMHQWRPEEPRLYRQPPKVVSGDEPHYLIIASSVLADGDLLLDNNYANVERGGFDAGAYYAGSLLDLHTFMVDYEHNISVKWSSVYTYNRRLPDGTTDAHGMRFESFRTNPLQPGTYVHVPAHPPAFSVAYALAMRPLHPAPDRAESTMGFLLILSACLTLAATYGAGIAGGLSRSEAVAAVALLGLCSPWLAYARSFYTEATVSLALTTALWAHLRRMPLAAGALISVAIWIKAQYALVAGAWLLLCVLQRRFKHAVLLGIVAACGTASLLAWNWSFARALEVGGAGTIAMKFSRDAAIGWLFDPSYGLFPFVPWAVLAAAWPLASLRRPDARFAAGAAGLPVVLHAAFLCGISFLSGWCYGCRHWVPYMPLLALLAAPLLRMHFAFRCALAALALAGLLFSFPAALQYTSDSAIWNQPPQTALLRMLRE